MGGKQFSYFGNLAFTKMIDYKYICVCVCVSLLITYECVFITYCFWYLSCFRSNGRYVLELDFEPFNANFPRPNRSSSIGNGVQFLNRHLSSSMFHNKDSLAPLLDFLRAHKYKGHVSLLSRGFLQMWFSFAVM